MSITFELEIKDGRVVRPVLSGEIPANSCHIFELIIPEGVTEIADDAFYSVRGLRFSKVTLPKSLLRIGHRAFKNSLERIRGMKFPPKLEFIGDEAFSCEDGDSFAKTLTIPNNVHTIGSRAFFNWMKLTTVKLGKSVADIGEGAFGLCTSLDSVTGNLADGNMVVCGDRLIAVYGAMDSFTVPDGIEEIGDYAFSSCRIDRDFYGDKKYGPETVTLNDRIRRIGKHALRGLRITELTIPDSVEEIGANPIYHSPVKTLYGKFTYQGRAIIVGNRLCAHVRIADSYEIPEGVEILEEDSFNNCRNQEVMAFPSSLRIIGRACFGFAQWIKELRFNDGLETIGEEAFMWCSALTTVTIPASVKEIGNDTFGMCEGIAKIVFEGDVPPACQGNIIRPDRFKGAVKVPAGSVGAYREVFPALAQPVPAYPNGRILENK